MFEIKGAFGSEERRQTSRNVTKPGSLNIKRDRLSERSKKSNGKDARLSRINMTSCKLPKADCLCEAQRENPMHERLPGNPGGHKCAWDGRTVKEQRAADFRKGGTHIP